MHFKQSLAAVQLTHVLVAVKPLPSAHSVHSPGASPLHFKQSLAAVQLTSNLLKFCVCGFFLFKISKKTSVFFASFKLTGLLVDSFSLTWALYKFLLVFFAELHINPTRLFNVKSNKINSNFLILFVVDYYFWQIY